MRWIGRASNALLTVERRLITLLAALLVLLILLNILSREVGAAIFWVDELAIYTMIWMALIASSAMLRMRMGVAVSLLTDRLPPVLKRFVFRLVDALLLFFAVVLLVLSWQWYDPIALISAGFDLDVFAQETFKFIYIEPTNTIGIRKFWVWLAVPLMAISMTVHALANLIEGPPEESADRPYAERGSGES